MLSRRALLAENPLIILIYLFNRNMLFPQVREMPQIFRKSCTMKG